MPVREFVSGAGSDSTFCSMSFKLIECYENIHKPPVIKRKQIFQESVKKKFTSKHFIVIYWVNYKQKQLISIYYNINCLITPYILACMYFLTVIAYLKKTFFTNSEYSLNLY